MRMGKYHQSTEFYLQKHSAVIGMIQRLNEIFPVQGGTCAVSSQWLMLDVKVVRLVCSELSSGQGRFWCFQLCSRGNLSPVTI